MPLYWVCIAMYCLLQLENVRPLVAKVFILFGLPKCKNLFKANSATASTTTHCLEKITKYALIFKNSLHRCFGNGAQPVQTNQVIFILNEEMYSAILNI